MDTRIIFQNPTKDSSNNIVTLEVSITAYWANGDKVYDETMSWNPPYDKRIPFDRFPQATKEQRKGKSEEEMKPILEVDEIYGDWHALIQQDPEFQGHMAQTYLQHGNDPREDDPQEGAVVPAKE
jgi:aspartate-semialdehyde dehydrogenase